MLWKPLSGGLFAADSGFSVLTVRVRRLSRLEKIFLNWGAEGIAGATLTAHTVVVRMLRLGVIIIEEVTKMGRGSEDFGVGV